MLPAFVFSFENGSAMNISFHIACCVSCRIMSFAIQGKDTGVLKVLVYTSELKISCIVLFPHMFVNLESVATLWSLKTSQPIPSHGRRGVVCVKFPVFRPIILRRRWIRSIGGIIPTGEIEVLGEKPVSVPLCRPQISLGLACDRTRACDLTTTGAMTRRPESSG